MTKKYKNKGFIETFLVSILLQQANIKRLEK